MIQVPGYPPCWISSIVQLPEFYEPRDLICGEFAAFTSDLYHPCQMYVRQGRNIRIQEGMTKYKLEVQCPDGVADVVCIATRPFFVNDIHNPAYDDICVFPIFIHYGREAFLYIQSINDLFRATSMVECGDPSVSPFVESPMGFIKRIDDYMMKSCLSTQFDTRYARMIRTDQLVSLFSSVQCSYSDAEQWRSGVEATYGIESNQVPMWAQIIGEIRNIGMLRRLLNPYGSVPSDVAAMVNQAEYYEVKEIMKEHGSIPYRCNDVYQNDAEDFSLVGALLGKIYEIPANSFEFPVRLDDRNCYDLYALKCNVYNDFKHSYERIVDWSIITSCLTGGFNLDSMSGELPDNCKELKAQRTWLEDIVVKDQNDNILLYVDMTWWILACSDGLINSSVLDSVTFA